MKAINGEEIRKHFLGAGCHIADEDYWCPSESWIERKLNPFFKKMCKEFGILEWQPFSDCDDHSSLYFVCAQGLWAKRRQVKPQAVAVGEIWYTTKSGGGHAINCAFTDGNGHEPILKFIEPQTCKLVRLTPAERSSVWFARF